MRLPQAIFFVVILEEVGLMAMGSGKLELKIESVVGQILPKSLQLFSSTLGCEADIISRSLRQSFSAVDSQKRT